MVSKRQFDVVEDMKNRAKRAQTNTDFMATKLHSVASGFQNVAKGQTRSKARVPGLESENQMADNEKLAELEGSSRGLAQSQTILVTAMMGFGAIFIGIAAIIVTIQIFTWQSVKDTQASMEASSKHLEEKFESTRIRTDEKLTSIERSIRDEFRAISTQNAAQINAISNAITATKAIEQPQSEQSPAQQDQ